MIELSFLIWLIELIINCIFLYHIKHSNLTTIKDFCSWFRAMSSRSYLVFYMI
ncbi:hypothetical protein C2G38_532184 [Gigaspora rosea]|uniref:Uncharacterized protein n=1 Tax=Gigaspora rosea TaxID=44941 RepID=A0A397UB01_9GLOM|nr:hypothetical protein C2G38_532184 [Gigaspora rosea]